MKDPPEPVAGPFFWRNARKFKTHHILGINRIFEKLPPHLEEGRSGEKRIRAGLVLRSYPWDLQTRSRGVERLREEQEVTTMGEGKAMKNVGAGRKKQGQPSAELHEKRESSAPADHLQPPAIHPSDSYTTS